MSGLDGLGGGGGWHTLIAGGEARKAKIARNTGLMRWRESERQTRSQLRTECAVSLRRQEVWLWSAENQCISLDSCVAKGAWTAFCFYKKMT